MEHIKKYFQNKNNVKINQIKNCVISENEKNEILEKIMNKKNNILSKEFICDLELLQGNYGEYENSIISKINYTNTNIGYYYLKDILLNPLNDKHQLEERQQIIKSIIENKNFDEINNQLKEIKKNEDELLWLWKNNDQEVNNFLDSVYFSNRFLKRFNNNEKLLNIFNYYKIFVAPLLGILYPVVAIILPYIIIRVFLRLPISFSVYYRIVTSTMGGNIFPMMSNNNLYKLSKFISSFLYVFFYLHNTYFSFIQALNTNKIINIIHQKMNCIYSYIKLARKINNLLEDIIPVKLEIFGKYIDHEIFNQEPAFISDKGIILSEYKKIVVNKDKLIPIIKYIGKVDSYFSIAQLYNFNKENKYYCLSKYIESDKPEINVNNIWHPYLNRSKVIRNNIQIGNQEKQNVIITGPNAGGKSTLIKSLILSILFSQTLTIAPCENISFTPFELLTTYLHIPDCKGKESLFEAEMNRSLSYINKLKSLQKENKFSMLVMDEIFNSTNPEEGISGAFAICKQFSKFTNNISIITTHFNYLTKLSKYNFENYKIPVIKDNNSILYTYKLQKGISHQFIALDLLREKGFDTEIIKQSQIIYKKIKKIKKNKDKSGQQNIDHREINI